MTEPLHLDYAPGTRRRTPKWLGICANVSLAYPAFVLGCLYYQWFLCWYMLGHRPQSSWDDPKYVDGASWMHAVTGLALTAALPMLALGVILNLAFMAWQWIQARKILPLRLAIRTLLFIGLWWGAVLFLKWDPWYVMDWWID